MFYTAFPGLTAGIMYGVPPYGYNYLSPQPPLLATPFINSANGTQNADPFPLRFPPHNVSAKNPDTGFDFAAVTPISADPYFYYRNSVPYTENYMFSIQRQIRKSTLLTVSYAGNEGHHLLVLVPANLGNPALCLSLSQPSQVAPGSSTCGPFGEDATYTSASGKTVSGDSSRPRSELSDRPPRKNPSEIRTTMRWKSICDSPSDTRATILAGYTYSKSIDQASNLGEQTNPFNASLTRVSLFLGHDA